MTGPKDKPTRDADRFEELHGRIGRGLDQSLAVQGSDEDEGAGGQRRRRGYRGARGRKRRPLPRG